MNKAVITCAVTGVLTDPQKHPVPVSVEEMAASCKEAYDAGASIMHVHFRNQTPKMGHLPTWDPEIAKAICDEIRAQCPDVLINMSTGVIGSDISGPVACLQSVKPELAACNAGSLNYLKARSNGSWAWPPMVFDNPVSKVQAFLDAMNAVNAKPEFECFDVGIVRSIALFAQTGMVSNPEYNFVMGVSSGMPCDPELLELLVKYKLPESIWQVTAIGRQEVWDLHQRTANLGGMLRTGLEDTFYLPNGDKARGNGDLVEALVQCAKNAGREVASPLEARTLLGMG